MNDRLGLSLSQSLVLLIVGTLVGGVSALIAILLCHYVLNFGGADSAEKHGISQLEATRIGGVMIVAYLSLNLAFQVVALGTDVLNEATALVLLGSLPFFCLGLYEDWHGVLSARFRFAAMIVFAALIVGIAPDFVIAPIGVDLLDAMLFNHHIVAVVITVICVAFLPNAFNTADGANGLISGIACVASIALAIEAPAAMQPFLYSTAVACLLFLVYNLATGRFFLGDGGAYFLGALVALAVIQTANQSDVAVGYLLSLISYPVIDLLFSMARRAVTGVSPFKPDNEHLHNLLFAMFNRSVTLGTQANTLSGLSIAVFFGCIPVVVYQGFGVVSYPAWLLLYLVLWAVYLGVWYWLAKRVCVLG